jgi:antitoxin component YwqK of YwqJK toxin-antitoxin module
MRLGYYKDCKLDGVYKRWFENSELDFVRFYKDGKEIDEIE